MDVFIHSFIHSFMYCLCARSQCRGWNISLLAYKMYYRIRDYHGKEHCGVRRLTPIAWRHRWPPGMTLVAQECRVCFMIELP